MTGNRATASSGSDGLLHSVDAIWVAGRGRLAISDLQAGMRTITIRVNRSYRLNRDRNSRRASHLAGSQQVLQSDLFDWDLNTEVARAAVRTQAAGSSDRHDVFHSARPCAGRDGSRRAVASRNHRAP